MKKYISPNDDDYICCPRERVPILGLYVKIYKFWKKCLDVYKREELRIYITTQIAATDGEIDRRVYELYGLTEEEISIVEGMN